MRLVHIETMGRDRVALGYSQVFFGFYTAVCFGQSSCVNFVSLILGLCSLQVLYTALQPGDYPGPHWITQHYYLANTSVSKLVLQAV